ncbi:MAG TPA: hypothetical protein VMR62_25380 [Bryobacteraceae bacterium]|jgi:hypothetical protein|nr:hypothetical protein [Bryobacteraceae bacterium]
MSPDIRVELTLRSENQRFPEALVTRAFEEKGWPRPTRLLTSDPKVRVFTLQLHHPSEDFIYGLQDTLEGTGAKIVRTHVTPALHDSLADIGFSAQLRIGCLEASDNFECCTEGCFRRAMTRLTFTNQPERYRSGEYCPRYTSETLDRLRIEGLQEQRQHKAEVRNESRSIYFPGLPCTNAETLEGMPRTSGKVVPASLRATFIGFTCSRAKKPNVL